MAPRTSRNRSTAPLTPEDEAASNFLKLFKKVYSDQDFFIQYFLIHDKAATFRNLKLLHKALVTNGTKTDRQLAKALVTIMERKEPISKGRVDESLNCRRIR